MGRGGVDTEGSDDHSQSLPVRRGRRPAARGVFSSREHTQYETHGLRRRTVWTIPVVLGDRLGSHVRGWLAVCRPEGTVLRQRCG